MTFTLRAWHSSTACFRSWVATSAAGLGGGVEVEEIAAEGCGVEVVGWEVLEEDAAGGEERIFFFEEEAYVAAVG